MTISRNSPHDNAPTETSKAPSVREGLKALQTPIRFLKGVGPKRAEQLEAFGLATIEDLLYHLPFRYEDRREIRNIRDARVGEETSFAGRLSALKAKFIPRLRRQIITATLHDETGSLALVWYRAPSYLAKSLADGQTLLIHGRVEQSAGSPKKIVHPEFDVLQSADDLNLLKCVLPIYVRPGGIPLSILRKWLLQALNEYAGLIPRCMPKPVADRQRLLNVAAALGWLHNPPADTSLRSLQGFSSPAHRSIIFDELFYLQLGLTLRKTHRRANAARIQNQGKQELISQMRALLTFKLTGAQERVLDEIEKDLAADSPMQRLIQGDVGCGKTMVAWLASLKVIEQGHQVLWMAPTELLAEQHFLGLKGFANELGIASALLTASTSAKEKKALLQRIESGEVQFVVGTHALIQQDVRAPRMALGVIDEQHRFGVLQRLSLQRLTGGHGDPARSAREPHMLLMSATPIPRSLAMVLYGDMDVSFIDEMPPGRTPIQTKVHRDADRRAVYAAVVDELRRGHQVFVVYPLVETSEQLEQVRDATQMAEKMRQGVFKDFGVGLVHGRMTAQERDEVMRLFRDGKVGVLVSTTVIEVGIDIPNATVMVIEHADRFGLSQLHQLRGRVGRGSAGGKCLLIDRSYRNATASERLRVMEKEHSGFKIAEADLALRGPGEFLGTRQSGMPDFRLANLLRDSKLLIEARNEAMRWLENDPQLKRPESAGLREVLAHRWGKRLQLGAVG